MSTNTDKRGGSFQNTDSSAKKAINRVKSDPDNSGRSARTTGSTGQETRRLVRPSSKDMKRPQGSSSQNARQGQRPTEQRQGGGQRMQQRQPQTRQQRDPNAGGQSRRQDQNVQRRTEERVRRENRSYIPLEEAEENHFSEIRINKKMRTWNKYKNYVYTGAAIVVLIIAIVVVMRSCSRKKPDVDPVPSQSMGALQPTAGINEPGSSQGGSSDPGTQQQSQQQTKPQTGSVLTTTRVAAKEEFTNKQAFDSSVFVGDAIASGISYYKFLEDSKVVADTNLTVTKAADRVDEIADAGPDRVYIMLGLNDLNYDTKTVDSITRDFDAFITKIKQNVPSAKIYLVSVTPITQACENKSNIYITMNNIESLNAKLKETAGAQGIYFVDINSSLQDSSGYLNSDITGNGYNMKSEYYGFMLNTIAEMTK